MQTDFNEDFNMGEVDGDNIYLSAPSWDCGWYWGFGYLGNKNCHYHIEGLVKKHNANLFDAIKKEFGNTLTIKDDSDLWTFCELTETAYTLKETAGVYGRGGSNYGTNPCEDIIVNKPEVERINKTVLPAIFNAIEVILKKYR
jgi:hypothetical protein